MTMNGQEENISSGVFHWDQLPSKIGDKRISRKIFEGSSTEFSFFEIHATTQEKGAVPSPPHTQEDIEEVIIIKEGTLMCVIGDKKATLRKGSVLLIPPHESQAFENTGNGPVTYYVFMFRSKKPMDIERSKKSGGILLLNADTLKYTETNDKGTIKYFDRPTAMTENYEMHITTLKKKGPSHAPHQHLDTEIILVIEGEVGMMIDGREYKGSAGDLFIAESGKLHGVSNTSDKTCSYFAFKWR